MFFSWLWQNLGTIIVLAVLVSVLVFIIVSRVKAKKRGESSCGCNCQNCAGRGVCHNGSDKKEI